MGWSKSKVSPQGSLMVRLHRFLSLDREEQRLFIRALVLMAAVRVALVFVPVTRITRFLDRIMKRCFSQSRTAPPELGRAAKRLEQAARLCPIRVTCLVQALVSRAILLEYGYPAKVCIGVLKSGAGIEAHAWLESVGQVTIGDREPAGKHFMPIVGAERLAE